MVNPAGIFFNSCYSESIYLAFFLAGFLFLVTERPSPWLASLLFAVTGAIRSNGFLNVGFIAHFQLHSIAQAYYANLGLGTVVGRLVSTIGQCLVVIAPFIGNQFYAYYRYCFNTDICKQSAALDCEKDHEWCLNDIPSVYRQGLKFSTLNVNPLRTQIVYFRYRL